VAAGAAASVVVDNGAEAAETAAVDRCGGRGGSPTSSGVEGRDPPDVPARGVERGPAGGELVGGAEWGPPGGAERGLAGGTVRGPGRAGAGGAEGGAGDASPAGPGLRSDTDTREEPDCRPRGGAWPRRSVSPSRRGVAPGTGLPGGSGSAGRGLPGWGRPGDVGWREAAGAEVVGRRSVRGSRAASPRPGSSVGPGRTPRRSGAGPGRGVPAPCRPGTGPETGGGVVRSAVRRRPVGTGAGPGRGAGPTTDSTAGARRCRGIRPGRASGVPGIRTSGWAGGPAGLAGSGRAWCRPVGVGGSGTTRGASPPRAASAPRRDPAARDDSAVPSGPPPRRGSPPNDPVPRRTRGGSAACERSVTAGDRPPGSTGAPVACGPASTTGQPGPVWTSGVLRPRGPERPAGTDRSTGPSPSGAARRPRRTASPRPGPASASALCRGRDGTPTSGRGSPGFARWRPPAEERGCRSRWAIPG
jgi:hypothetical protein